MPSCRRALLAVVTTALLAATLVGGSVRGAAAAADSAGSSQFTAYVGYGNPNGLRAFGDRTGVPINYATDYMDDRTWSHMDDVWEMGNWQGSGFQMIWGVPMLPQSGGTLSEGATGAYDQYFTTIAQDLVSHGMGSSILRLGWEFNNPGDYPWYAGGQADAFTAYWRHIVTAMRAVPGADFRFVWNPNLGDNNGPSDNAMGNLELYYPGDAYVDLVGLDAYDINWNNYPGTPREMASIETRTWGLNWLARFGAQHSKPLAIPEFGLGWGDSAGDGQPYHGSGIVCGGDNPSYIQDMADWIHQHNVAVSGFWDHSFSSVENGEHPRTAAALSAGFGPGSDAPSPGNPPAPPTTTQHQPRSHPATVTLHRATPRHHRLRLRGRLSPGLAHHKIVIQTAGSQRGAKWRSRGHVLTRKHGRYVARIRRSHARRYVRVVSVRRQGLSVARSRPVRVGSHHRREHRHH